MKTNLATNLRKKIRVIEDFPKKGILFQDITSITDDAKLLAKCSDGVIIGSSIVKMIEESSNSREFDRIGQYITEIKQAIS